MINKSKLVLAYSGGLDTSYSLQKLSQDDFEVHAVSINTGGFSQNEIEIIQRKAYQMGAHLYKNIDALDSFYKDYASEFRSEEASLFGDKVLLS